MMCARSHSTSVRAKIAKTSAKIRKIKLEETRIKDEEIVVDSNMVVPEAGLPLSRLLVANVAVVTNDSWNL